jgi:short-subunit dehydrogenase
MSSDKHFNNKVVLITGASSGIGAELARAFSKEGAKLALLARRTDRLQTLVADCEKQGTKATAITCDVTHDSALPLAVENIHNTLGTIDIVIANAGFGVIEDFEKLTLADFERQFQTNLYGVLRTIFASLTDLKKTKGRLVLVGSALGHMVLPQYSAYCMSKHAITSLATSLYIELARYGISVTLISPGYINTEFRNINNLGQYQEGLRASTANRARMDADIAARIIIEAIRQRKRECIITLLGKVGVLINRLFPGFLPWYYQRKFANP